MDPHPGKSGDKEKLKLPGRRYRINVSRSFTIFYRINEKDKRVDVTDIMTIEKAHKIYGRL